jgi:hypothetical protein
LAYLQGLGLNKNNRFSLGKFNQKFKRIFLVFKRRNYMGFIDAAPGTTLPLFYNVVRAVGNGCPNQSADVKLIQYLLMAFYEKSAEIGVSRPGGEMALTGYCGPVTRQWILKFQMDANQARPGWVALDGQIDRIRQKNLKGSISGTFYTLAALNSAVSQSNPAAYAALTAVVPLQNPLTVPPPSADIVSQSGTENYQKNTNLPYSTQPQVVPASGGM